MMTAAHVYDAILGAAARQIATSPEGARILAAGLGEELRVLVDQIAANSANPIADAAEDALLLALATRSPLSSPTASGSPQGEAQVGDERDGVCRKGQGPEDAEDHARSP